jgi:inhibitor of the pro-sigma K processing machinery
MSYLNLALAFGFALLVLFLVGRVFYQPLKLVAKVGIKFLIGVVVLWGLNLLGSPFGLVLPINPVTAFTVGYLGIPGALLLVTLRVLIV